MSGSTMKTLGQLNRGWGVCGFTSTFYAMYRQNPATRGWIINATQVYSVLYEICDYLKLLQAKDPKLLKDIETFTQSFGAPYDSFTAAGYIAKVESASEVTRQILSIGDNAMRKDEHEALRDDELFGIAMPPHAVADYVVRCWKWNAVTRSLASCDQVGDAIVGVRDVTDTKLTMYHGLCHYLYRGGGKYYSWGREIESLERADPNYEIIWTIAVSKP